MSSESSDASPSDAPTTPTSRLPGAIQHMPRKRAVPPMLPQHEASLRRAAEAQASAGTPQLSREQVSHAYDILEQRRVGPHAIKYGCLGSVGLIAYTYLRGFVYLAQKNRDAWVGTFRQRIFVLGPVIAAYATANDVIPLPFKDSIATALNRTPINMFDIVTAKETVKKAQELPLSAQV